VRQESRPKYLRRMGNENGALRTYEAQCHALGRQKWPTGHLAANPSTSGASQARLVPIQLSELNGWARHVRSSLSAGFSRVPGPNIRATWST
jgi:hypothetical protein